MTTPVLGLTELSPTTSERSTIIDAHRVLDAMWGRVASANININTPPTSPVDGTSVLIGSAPTGDFSGFAGHLALFIGTGWQFVSPDKLGFVQTDTGPHEPNGTLDGWVPLTLPAGSPLTTKGDIITYNNGDVRLAVGTDGQVLVANSATPTGLEWVTQPPGGSALIIEDNGTPLSTNATKLNFTNFTITEPNPDEFDITAPSGGGGGGGSISQNLTFQYEAEDFTDSTGGPALTEFGSVPIVTGKSGNAWDFTSFSVANRLEAPALNPGHIYGNFTYSISVWVNTNQGPGNFRTIYGSWNSTSRECLIIQIASDSKISALVTTSGSGGRIFTVSNTALNQNTWYHIVFTVDRENDETRLYVNGALEATTSIAGLTLYAGTAPGCVGAHRLNGSTTTYSTPMAGLIDQLVRIDSALTQSEITALYNSGNGVADAQSVFVSTGSGFTLTDVDVINYFTNHATLASTHEQVITQNLVVRLKDTGLWSKIEFLWVNLGDSVANVLVPLKGTAGTATRAITSADIEATGGLNPDGSFIRLNFPALSSTSSYHLGWSKLPSANVTDGGVFGQIHYRDVSAELTGLKMEAIDNQNALWYAPGVGFAVAGSTVRSYEAGGFVGTTDGTVRLAAKSTSSTFSLTNTPTAISTGQLTFALPTASPLKQPAFCAGQHLSLLEMTTLQMLLEEYAKQTVSTR